MSLTPSSIRFIACIQCSCHRGAAQTMPEQQWHPVMQCLCLLKYVLMILLMILLIPFIIAFGLVYLVLYVVFFFLFAGPLVYYRTTILNSNALSEKYVQEGIQLEGRVMKRWKTEGKGVDSPTTYHVRVEYRVNDTRFSKEFTVSRDIFPQETLELIRLSEYPQSAVLFASVKDADPDFPPSKQGNFSKAEALYFAFGYLTILNLVPTAMVLSSIDSCIFCSMLIAPVFVGLVVLEMVVGYWVARKNRDSNLNATLFGATQDNNNLDIAAPKHVSYQEFCQEDTHSFLFVIRTILQDVGIVLGTIVALVYFVVLGGGCIIMYSLVIAKWINRQLERYESNGDTVSGSVVCRQHNNEVIVQYQVDGQMYKKRLKAPLRLVTHGWRLRY